ncbi:MAG: 4-hydroxythreonine-4-phosphate dehydrogenase PdxA [Alkalispirochaeta sp.]
MRPRIQLLFGDTAGVGPEICAKVLADLPGETGSVQVIATGDGRVLEEAIAATGVALSLPAVSTFEEVEASDAPVVFWDYRSEDTPSIPRAAVSEAAGREVLTALTKAITLAKEEKIDGVVFAPFNKESMHRAGSSHYSELELFKEQFGRPDIPGEFNIMDGLWIARVTSHIPVGEIASTLSVERIAHTIELLGESQVRAGVTPIFAVAALNPHAGEHGMFGDEERRLIEPAIKQVATAHPDWALDGPMPADTMFPRVLKGTYTGVIGMYHDQLQIATKLIGLERGVTFHPGMKVPIATAAHGTAFDIRGTGAANHQALKNAVSIVSEIAAGAGNS